MRGRRLTSYESCCQCRARPFVAACERCRRAAQPRVRCHARALAGQRARTNPFTRAHELAHPHTHARKHERILPSLLTVRRTAKTTTRTPLGPRVAPALPPVPMRPLCGPRPTAALHGLAAPRLHRVPGPRSSVRFKFALHWTLCALSSCSITAAGCRHAGATWQQPSSRSGPGQQF